MTRRDCLIISSEFDYHSCALRYAIRSAGGNCEILDTTKLLHNAVPTANISISDGGIAYGSLAPSARKRSVWARRMFQNKDLTGTPSKYASYVYNESKEFEENMLKLLEADNSAHWINRPSSVSTSEIKAYQLSIAASCGLSVPNTLITADPTAIRAFCSRYEWVVLKPFRPHSWQDDTLGKKWTTFANKIRHADVVHCDDADLSAAPCIYQQYVPTVSDIRVGVIGDMVFALEMRHQVTGKIDFRTMNNEELAHRRCNVPEDVIESLQALMKALDVSVASADFILDERGKWNFIELNPSGAFLFLEDKCPEIEILAAAASLLCYGRVVGNYAEQFPNLSAFIHSPDHERWLAEWACFDSANRHGRNITYLNEV